MNNVLAGDAILNNQLQEDNAKANKESILTAEQKPVFTRAGTFIAWRISLTKNSYAAWVKQFLPEINVGKSTLAQSYTLLSFLIFRAKKLEF